MTPTTKIMKLYSACPNVSTPISYPSARPKQYLCTSLGFCQEVLPMGLIDGKNSMEFHRRDANTGSPSRRNRQLDSIDRNPPARCHQCDPMEGRPPMDNGIHEQLNEKAVNESMHKETDEAVNQSANESINQKWIPGDTQRHRGKTHMHIAGTQRCSK